MVVVEVTDQPRSPSEARVRRFAVSWRNSVQRRSSMIGVLEHDGSGFTFRYLPQVDRRVADFKPFIGFPDVDRLYRSPRLWPFFALRVMDRKRPDYALYVARLGLTPDAGRLDVLARSGGERKGDSVSVIEEPAIAVDGSTHAVFLARGTRYAVSGFETSKAVELLTPGAALDLADDSANVANGAALLLVTEAGDRVGWVPDLLIGYCRALRAASGRVTVVQNNGPEAPWHMRLLVRVDGKVTAAGIPTSPDGWQSHYASATPLDS